MVERNQRGSGLSDEELLEKARNAANGRKFELRFSTEYEDPAIQRHYDSQRQAEVALLANLAFWSGCDKRQMWRLFQRSSLYREKLESFPDYRRKLLETATELVDDTYSHAGYA